MISLTPEPIETPAIADVGLPGVTAITNRVRELVAEHNADVELARSCDHIDDVWSNAVRRTGDARRAVNELVRVASWVARAERRAARGLSPLGQRTDAVKTNLDGTPRVATARDHTEAWRAVADFTGEHALNSRGVRPMVDGYPTMLPLDMVAELLAVARAQAGAS